MLFPNRKYEVDNPEWLYERYGGKTILEIALKGHKKDLKTTKKQIDAAFIEGLKSGSLTNDKVMFKTGENRIYKQSRKDTDFLKTEPVINYYKRINVRPSKVNFGMIKNSDIFLTITDEFSIFDSKVYNSLKADADYHQDPESIYRGISDYRKLYIKEKHLGLFNIKELIGTPDIIPDYNEGKRRAKQNKKTIKSSFDITPIKVADKNVNTNSSPQITEIPPSPLWKGISLMGSIGKNAIKSAFFIIDDDGAIDDNDNINDVKKTLDNIYDENTDEALYDNLDKPISEYKQFNKIQENANKTSLFLAQKEGNPPFLAKVSESPRKTRNNRKKVKPINELYNIEKNVIEDKYSGQLTEEELNNYEEDKKKLDNDYINYKGKFAKFKKKK